MEMPMARGQITPLLLLLLLSATQPSLAQQSNSTSPHSRTGGFTPTTVVVLVILIFAFVLLTLFSIYINRCAQARALPRRAFRSAAPAQTVDAAARSDQCRPRGVDRELVEAFPTAVYGDVKAHMATKSGPLECAVCLTEFADSDELRVLPACCHVFHPDCIDPWLAGAVTCPLCRADLTEPPALPAAESWDLTGHPEMVQEESKELDDDACSVVTFTPESVTSFSTIWRHEFTGSEYCHYRRTQSAMDAPDRHTLRLPEHVMKELAAIRRHRRAASLAEYPDAVERTPGWLTSFLRSVSWQRQSRADPDAGEEHGGSKRVYPVAGTPAEKPSGSGSGGDEKESSDADALNRV